MLRAASLASIAAVAFDWYDSAAASVAFDLSAAASVAFAVAASVGRVGFHCTSGTCSPSLLRTNRLERLECKRATAAFATLCILHLHMLLTPLCICFDMAFCTSQLRCLPYQLGVLYCM